MSTASPSTSSVAQKGAVVKIEPVRCIDGYYLRQNPPPTPHNHPEGYNPNCPLCAKPEKMSLCKWYLFLVQQGALDVLAREFRNLRDQRHWQGTRNQAFYDLSWLIPVLRWQGLLGCLWEEEESR